MEILVAMGAESKHPQTIENWKDPEVVEAIISQSVLMGVVPSPPPVALSGAPP